MKIPTALKYAYRALAYGDTYAQYVLAESLSRLVYPRYKFSEFGRLFLEDDDFIGVYEHLCGLYNYHSLDRKYTLDQMMKLVKHVAGDTAECGAYEGASSFFICRNIRSSEKRHHVFDSFEGLSTPGEEDGNYWSKGDLWANESKIRESLHEFDFILYYKGWIPTRFREVEKRRFSFVHLDVDLYQPTWDSLGFFYPRVSQGGIILCDDYGFATCPGARRAMSEFFADKREDIVSLPTGQGFVIKS